MQETINLRAENNCNKIQLERWYDIFLQIEQ